ncbi:MAG: hypothetical protein ACF8R7_02790, partial [Phycisphaerales bacterium JB039]
MSRKRAGAIRAVGLSAGAICLLATGALAISSGADPAAVQARPVSIPPLPAPPAGDPDVYPSMIAEMLQSAYEHDFPDETGDPEQTQAQTPQTPPPSLRMIGAIGAGDGAVAVIGMDAEQLLLGPGESGPDFRVEEIYPDRVIITRSGTRHVIALGDRQGPLAGDLRPGGAGAGQARVAGGSQAGPGASPRATQAGGITAGEDGLPGAGAARADVAGERPLPITQG